MLEITNLGWANSNSLQFSLVKRQSRGYQYRVAYTLSNTFGNTAVARRHRHDHHAGAATDLNLEQGEARTTQDRPHVLSIERVGRSAEDRRAECERRRSSTRAARRSR